MEGKLVGCGNGKLPVHFFILACDRGQPASLEETGAGIAQDVHFEPGFSRFVDIQPAIGFAGIYEKFPFTAFTGKFAFFNSFCCAHEIDLPSAISSCLQLRIPGRFPAAGDGFQQPTIQLYVERLPLNFTAD